MNGGLERERRLAESLFGDVIEKMTKPRCRPKDYAKKLTKDSKIPSKFTQAILDYGVQNESTAVCKYIEYMNAHGHWVKTYRCGLIVSPEHFWLGASPDRKGYDPQSDPPYGLIEVKCLGKKEYQVTHPKDRCTDENFYVSLSGDEYKLKTAHKHYKQVQGQMALAGVSWCDFLVYSDVGMLIIRINYDSDFEGKDLKLLNDFYFNYYLPVLSASVSN